MATVTSLGHVGLYVRDIERSKAFYRGYPWPEDQR